MNTVKWANDDHVALCPSCAKSFNIGRRRHHCRLCGAIMCHDCSQFLELNYARKLIAPVNLENPDQPVVHVPPSGIVANEGAQSPGGKLMAKLTGKTSSLLNLSIGKEANNHEVLIRACADCKLLLDKRNRQVEDRHAKPPIKTLYEKLKELQAEADKLVPTYLKMCDSLRTGETTYQLTDAKVVRIQLMKLTDAIAVVSRKLHQLDVVEDEPPPPTMPIQNKLRLFASQYIRDVMCGLPNLPREEELQQLQEQRHRQLQTEIELEKRKRAMGEPAKSSPFCSATSTRKAKPKTNDDVVSYNDGWGFQNLTIDEDLKDLDPMVVQINILKDYIKQARKEHRYDEVNMLENNLQQLEIEYYLQDDSNLPPRTSDESDSLNKLN
jgi:rabenosyn-5